MLTFFFYVKQNSSVYIGLYRDDIGVTWAYIVIMEKTNSSPRLSSTESGF